MPGILCPVRTAHDIPFIYTDLLDEAETIHQLDLRDLTGAMAAEMFLDVALSHCDNQLDARDIVPGKNGS
jgi:hypothetical protein